MMRILLPLLLLFFSISLISAQSNTEQNLAFQYYQDGDYEKAASLFLKLYDKDPTPANYRYLYNSLLFTKNYETLEKLIRKNIKKEPDNLTYLVDLGYYYNQTGNLTKGKSEYETALKNLKPDETRIIQLASAFQNYGELEMAAQTYEKGRNLLGYPGHFALELASLYSDLNNPKKAIENYLDYFELNPGGAQTVKNLLQGVLQKKAFADELHTQLLQRIQKNPQAVFYAELLIWHFIQQKNFKAAALQAKALDKRLRENGYRLINIARFAAAENDYDQAMEAYDYVIEKGINGPFYKTAREEKLLAYKKKITQSYDYSENDLLTLDAEFDQFLNEFGITSQTAEVVRQKAELQAFYLNNYDKAISLLDNLIQNRSVEPRLRGEFKLLLGDFYIMKDELWEASLLYGQVDKEFKDEPLGELARFKQAKLSYYRGDFEWAQAQLDILKSATTQLISNDAISLSVFITDNLGLDTTTWPMLKFARADLIFYQNKLSDALQELDSILHVFPTHPLTDDVYFMKAKILMKKHDYTGAAAFLEKIITDYANDLLGDDALFKLAELQETVFQDKEKAMQLYQQLLFNYKDSIYLIEARKRFRKLRGDQL
ncbi:MAG: hypothetical protein KatS3mg031_2467 [Chitinophagales bacterium]|nr:MAG: hypothetical protein KatS3mg031_2467 [Chitinophagales bacterium]